MTSEPTSSNGRSRVASAYTTCPFCSGGKILALHAEDGSKAQVLKRLAGVRVQCDHPQCGRTYTVRRDDIRVRLVGPARPT